MNRASSLPALAASCQPTIPSSAVGCLSASWPIGDAAEVEHAREAARSLPTDVAVRFLQVLPKMWAKVKGGRGRQMLASALLERIDVLGILETPDL